MEQIFFKFFDESSTHYRHLEKQRTQYLGFLFAVLSGTIGLALGRFNMLQSNRANYISGIEILLILNIIISSVCYLGLKKNQFALRRHGSIIWKTADSILNNYNTDYSSLMKEFGKQHKFSTSKTYDINELVNLLVIVVGLSLTFFSIFFFFILLSEERAAYQIVLGLALVSSIFFQIISLFKKLRG